MAQCLTESFAKLAIHSQTTTPTAYAPLLASSRKPSRSALPGISNANFGPQIVSSKISDAKLAPVASLPTGVAVQNDPHSKKPLASLCVTLPHEVLELFWQIMPVKNVETVQSMQAYLARLFAEPVRDYGWIVQTYYALLELYDALWAQFLVWMSQEIPPWVLGLDDCNRVLSKTIQLVSSAIRRLEEFADPFGLEPLTCIKESRVSSYPEDHPFRVIQQYVRVGDEELSNF